MLRQSSLFDVHAAAPPCPPSSWPPTAHPPDDQRRHNPFFALRPGADDAQRLHAHARCVESLLGLRGRALEPERLHVTLHHVGEGGEVPDPVDIARWSRAAAAVRCAPFEIVFDRVSTFGDEGRPLVFTSSDDAGILAVHRALGMALADTGEPIRRSRIAPHLTISYGAKRLAETAIEPVRWQARELVLIDSHIGEHVHEVIGRWPLQG